MAWAGLKSIFAGKQEPASVEKRYDGFHPLFIRESYTGAWQNNDLLTAGEVLQFPPAFACVTLISDDIGAMPFVMRREQDGILVDVSHPILRVLRKPNAYQNYIQFKQWWIMSKLRTGNAYVLKERDNGRVVRLYVLDPFRVVPIVSEDGQVFYRINKNELSSNYMSRVEDYQQFDDEQVVVPASEIIHDRMNTLFHPLVGISPLYSAAMAISAGSNILSDSSTFFGHGARPSGILSAPGSISEETAKRLKDHWEAGYSGRNAGKVAILGDDLKFQPMRYNAIDGDVVNQLRMSAEMVCTAFRVPPYKIGLKDLPSGRTVYELNQVYHQDCLHILIEEMEQCLDDSLDVPTGYSIDLDTSSLLRMDDKTRHEMLRDDVRGGLRTPNEGRRAINLKPLTGGDSLFMQQQDIPLHMVEDYHASQVGKSEPVTEVVDQPDDGKSFIEAFRKALQ